MLKPIVFMRQIFFLYCVCTTTIYAQTSSKQFNLGINTGGTNDWNLENPFADVIKTFRLWQTVELDANQNIIDHIPPLDEHGWPTTDFRTIVYHDKVRASYGTYKMKFTGQATIGTWQAQVKNKAYNSETNSTTLDLVISNPDNEALIINFTNTQGLKNIQLMQPLTPGDSNSYPFDQIITNEYLNLLAPYSTIRYMGWTNTNGSNDSLWDNTVPWNYSTLAVEHSYASWESVIKFANATQKDAWICVPHKASDNYIKQLALLFKNGSKSVESLDPHLNLYVEYSNEIWNWGGPYPQTAWVSDQAQNIGHPLTFDGTTNETTLMYRYKAMQSVKISEIFREVFGNNQMMKRIRPVICWQSSWIDLTARTITFIDRYYNKRDSRSDRSVAHPLNYYFYGGGGTNYWNHGEDNVVTTESIWDSGGWNEYSFADDIYADASWARAFGMQYLSYEGDNHPFFNGDDEIYREIHWDERMHKETIDHLNAFAWVGGDLSAYLVLSNYGDETVWGAYNFMTGLDGSPQYRAMLDIANTQTPKITYGKTAPFSTPGMAFDALTIEAPNITGTGPITLTADTDGFATAYMFKTESYGECPISIEYQSNSASTFLIEYDGSIISDTIQTHTSRETTPSISVLCDIDILHSIRVVVLSGSIALHTVQAKFIPKQMPLSSSSSNPQLSSPFGLSSNTQSESVSDADVLTPHSSSAETPRSPHDSITANIFGKKGVISYSGIGKAHMLLSTPPNTSSIDFYTTSGSKIFAVKLNPNTEQYRVPMALAPYGIVYLNYLTQ